MVYQTKGGVVHTANGNDKVDGAVDVVEEIVLAEEEIEVCLPCEEVGRGVGELDRHALEDGDVADDGDGGAGEGVGAPRSRGGEGVGVVGGAGAREVGHCERKRGRGDAEERRHG